MPQVGEAQREVGRRSKSWQRNPISRNRRRPPAEPRAALEASGSGVKEPQVTAAPALPDAATLAQVIYRAALEQKDAATLLRLAEALYPETFEGARLSAPVRKVAGSESLGA